MITPARITLSIALACTLIACKSGGGSGSDSGLRLSGQLSIPVNTVTDSDVNDSLATYASNNDPSTPQSIPNRVTVHGFASAVPTFAAASDAGDFERFDNDADEDDYFSVSLQAGQKITLQVVDFEGNNTGSAYSGDLDLYLFKPPLETSILSSLNESEFEEIIVPADGEYLVNVYAYSGISKYVLRIQPADTSITSTSNSKGFAPFVLDQAVVQWKDNSSAANAKALSGIEPPAETHSRALGTTRLNADHYSSEYPAKVKMARIQAAALTPLQAFNPELARARQTLIDIKRLNERDDVEFAEPNYIRHALRTPNDPLYRNQYHYNDINLPQAWDITTGSRAGGGNVIVAVLDTGVFLAHPDLSNQLVSGYDFISDSTNANDGNGIDSNPDDPGDSTQRGGSSWHGTHVSGTVAAETNNSTGGAGVSWSAKIMPVRVLGTQGGESSDIIQGIRYAAGLSNNSGTVPSQKADIINMSLGSYGASTAEQNAITAARNAGVIIVAAAGNDGSSELSYPASYNGVISVSAIGPDGNIAYYSNSGSKIDVAAPGGDLTADRNADGQSDGVLSTSVNDASGARVASYYLEQGTSMATPHVAGVLALMKAVNPDLTPVQVDNALAAGELTDQSGRNNEFGYGVINAYKAVVAAQNIGGTSSTTPVLESSPNNLSLGTDDSANFTVSNANQDSTDPMITSVTDDANWLTVSSSSVDANGLGSYSVTLDRTDLIDGIYDATITVTPDSGYPLSISVTMQVGDVVSGGGMTQQYILLLDADSENEDVVAETQSDSSGNYEFTGLKPGRYIINAGSDIDVDLLICQSGETCGAYPSLGAEQIIELTDTDRANVDFVISVIGGFNSSAASVQSRPITNNDAEKSNDTEENNSKQSVHSIAN
ncbi:S8 family peptidase [Thalassolituus sp.]|uniref:S8 family peptidase n=1 Tax=Thalassolituus sp. TaxID=2030822 RepID=UPI002A82ED1F|nr:S8 family peptidase [Thalassolituus sp.]